MRDHKLRGDLTDEEFKKYVQFIEGVWANDKMSNELYAQFSDITPMS